jgi:hypothetical protein
MKTIITIKKKKPAFKALILLAKELEKNDHTSISVCEGIEPQKKMDLSQLTDTKKSSDFFDQFSLDLGDFTFDRDELYAR